MPRLAWLFGLMSFAVTACANVGPAVLPGLPHGDRPIVFVADGAGDYRACSGTLRSTAAADGMSFEVCTFVWSHGYLRNIIDQTDYEFARQRGSELAAVARDQKATHPETPITLVGHSAGSAVVLAAVESLPPGVIERVVLLAPSLSEGYDLRTALTNVNDGIDVFVSEKDWIWLGVLVRLFGTTDNPFAARAAGRFGFVVAPRDRDEADLYGKLRLHRWTPEQGDHEHDGGHFGCYQPGFLRKHVFPVMFGQGNTSFAAPAKNILK